DPYRQVADGHFAGSQGLEHAQALRIGERPSDGCKALPVGFTRDDRLQHAPSLSLIAQTRKSSASEQFRRDGVPSSSSGTRQMASAILPRMSDHLVPLVEIAAAREVIAGRFHRTPTLSSAAAAAEIRAAGGPAIANGRLHLKAEHFQKTCSFK